MNGGSIAAGTLRTMIEQEAAAAGLWQSRSTSSWIGWPPGKGGSYDYCPNFDGSGACDPAPVSAGRPAG